MSQDDFLAAQRDRFPWPWTDESGVPILSPAVTLDFADLHYFFDALVSTIYRPKIGLPIPRPEHCATLNGLKFQLQQIFGPLTGYFEPMGTDEFEDHIVRSDLGIAIALIATHARPQKFGDHFSQTFTIDALGDDFIKSVSGGPTYPSSTMPEGLCKFVTEQVRRGEDTPPSDEYEYMAQIALAYEDLHWTEQDIKVYQYLIETIAPLCEGVVESDCIVGIPDETRAFIFMNLKEALRTQLNTIVDIANQLELTPIGEYPPWPEFGPQFRPDSSE